LVYAKLCKEQLSVHHIAEVNW